jgi:hypothetical protein
LASQTTIVPLTNDVCYLEFAPVPKPVLTSSSIESDQKRARQFGACPFFVKPSQLNDLVKTVVDMNVDWITEHCPLT